MCVCACACVSVGSEYRKEIYIFACARALSVSCSAAYIARRLTAIATIHRPHGPLTVVVVIVDHLWHVFQGFTSSSGSRPDRYIVRAEAPPSSDTDGRQKHERWERLCTRLRTDEREKRNPRPRKRFFLSFPNVYITYARTSAVSRVTVLVCARQRVRLKQNNTPALNPVRRPLRTASSQYAFSSNRDRRPTLQSQLTILHCRSGAYEWRPCIAQICWSVASEITLVAAKNAVPRKKTIFEPTARASSLWYIYYVCTRARVSESSPIFSLCACSFRLVRRRRRRRRIFTVYHVRLLVP